MSSVRLSRHENVRRRFLFKGSFAIHITERIIIMPPVKLITKAEWDKLSAKSRGYACYCQGSLPGSELKDLECPYPMGTQEARDFASGEFEAMMEAQDAED
jgi:hypothetical protein